MDLRYPETLKEYGKPGAKKDGDGGAEDGEEKEHPAIARVRCMMGREIRVKVVDGRVFVGRFECYDKQGNILMEDAMSTTLDDPEGTEPHVPRDDHHSEAAQGGDAADRSGRRVRSHRAGL